MTEIDFDTLTARRTYKHMAPAPSNRAIKWAIALVIGTLLGPAVWAIWIYQAFMTGMN